MRENGATIDGVIQMNQVLEQGRSYGHGWVKGILRRESSQHAFSQRHTPNTSPSSVLTNDGEAYGMHWLDCSARL